MKVTVELSDSELKENLPPHWEAGAKLPQERINAGALDLLIVAVAVHHDAELMTFDRDFETIAGVCALRVTFLQRPIP